MKKTTLAHDIYAEPIHRLRRELEALEVSDPTVESIHVVMVINAARRVELRLTADGDVTIKAARPTPAKARARREQAHRERFDQMLPLFPDGEWEAFEARCAAEQNARTPR